MHQCLYTFVLHEVQNLRNCDLRVFLEIASATLVNLSITSVEPLKEDDNEQPALDAVLPLMRRLMELTVKGPLLTPAVITWSPIATKRPTRLFLWVKPWEKRQFWSRELQTENGVHLINLFPNVSWSKILLRTDKSPESNEEEDPSNDEEPSSSSTLMDGYWETATETPYPEFETEANLAKAAGFRLAYQKYA
jgi:hypothetical protein